MPTNRRTKSNDVPVAVGMGLIALDIVFTATEAAPPKWYAGGTCGNVLTILSYLGWETYPFGRLRTDRAADRLLQDLRSWSVSTEFLARSADGSTPVIIQRIKRLAGIPHHSFSWRCPSCGGYLPGYKPVLASAIEKTALRIPSNDAFFFDRVSRSTLLMAKISRKRGAVVVFEPAGVGDPSLFREAWEVSHIVKYSHERLRELAELGLGQGSADRPLLEIETMGSEGLRYRSRLPNAPTSGWAEAAPYPVPDAMDMSGAGDWCTAGLLNVLARHGSKGLLRTTSPQMQRGLQYAQALAAWNCRFEGARGAMYHKNRVELEAEVEKIVRGASEAREKGASKKTRAGGTVADLCRWCNKQSSIAKPVARSSKRK